MYNSIEAIFINLTALPIVMDAMLIEHGRNAHENGRNAHGNRRNAHGNGRNAYRNGRNAHWNGRNAHGNGRNAHGHGFSAAAALTLTLSGHRPEVGRERGLVAPDFKTRSQWRGGLRGRFRRFHQVLELRPHLRHLRHRHRPHVGLMRIQATIVLVLGLGRIEARQRLQGGHDRTVVDLGVVEVGDHRLGKLLLLRRRRRRWPSDTACRRRCPGGSASWDRGWRSGP